MTSANFSTGYDADKPTSRVLRPPGGASSNIFGGYEESNRAAAGEAQAYKPKTTKDNIFGPGESTEKAAPVKAPQTSNVFSTDKDQENTADQQDRKPEEENGEKENDENEAGEKENEAGEKESETAAHFAEHDKNLAASRGAFNPITGEASSHHVQKPVHTSTKVRQPPGGASSGLW